MQPFRGFSLTYFIDCLITHHMIFVPTTTMTYSSTSAGALLILEPMPERTCAPPHTRLHYPPAQCCIKAHYATLCPTHTSEEQTAQPLNTELIKNPCSFPVSLCQSFTLTLSQHQKLKVGTRTLMKWRRVSSPLNQTGLRMLQSHQGSAPSALWCPTRLSSSSARSWADSNMTP